MSALGEVQVEKRDDCVALIVRTTDRWRPWDVWTIVNQADRFGDDATYGAPGFEPHRPLAKFYVNDIGYWARRVGKRRGRDAAERSARRALDRFLRWRDRQVAAQAELEPPSPSGEETR